VATSRLTVMPATVVALLSIVTADAQVQRSGGGANAQLFQQYQQALTERGQLQAENEKLKKSLDDLKKQLDASQQQLGTLKSGASRGQAALVAAQASNESTVKALATTQSKMQELISHFKETAAALRGVETERTQLLQELAQSKAAYDKCAERNYELYQIANDVLNHYQHQGMFSYMERAEPFTRLKQTQIDNLVLDYRARAEELRLKGATPSPAGAAAGPGTTVPSAAPASAVPPQAPPPSATPKSYPAPDAPARPAASNPSNP